MNNLSVAGVITNMCLEINSAASSAKINMEFRTNCRPVRGKYNYLYSLLYVYVIYNGTQIFSVFTATSFKMPKRELRQHNTAQWHGPVYPHYSTKNTRMQSYATWPAISKQKA